MRFRDTEALMAEAALNGVQGPAAETRSFGDRSAWLARHVLPHEPALRAWLQQRAVEGLESADIIHETYAVLAALDGVEHIVSPRLYAFQIAHSVMLRHLRSLRIIWIGARGLDAAMAGPSFEPQASSPKAARRARDLIAELPPECREAFSLRKIEGLSQRDIAIRMAIPESKVEEHVGRALRLLMSTMNAD